jgi:hypothetical protein
MDDIHPAHEQNSLSHSVEFFLSGPSSGQDAVEIFAEDFENTVRDWNEVKKDDHIRIIQDGKLTMATNAKTFYWCGQNIVPDKKKNFRMETELIFSKFKSGEAGLMWGDDSQGEKMYFFLLSPNGSWNYGVWSPSFFSYTGSQKTTVVNKGLATNKLKVEKIGSKLKLYINDVEVHSAKFPSSKGTLMGLVSGGGNHAVEADYFKVSELPRE